MAAFDGALAALNSVPLAAFGNCTVAWTGGSCAGLYQTAYLDTLGINNRDNTLLVADADIAGLSSTAAITIDGVSHTQRERQPDGNGMTRIVVSKA